MSMKESTREEIEERLRKMEEANPMVIYCRFCPKWKAVGTVKVTREKAEAHRLEKHPDLKISKRNVRRARAFSTAMTAEREAVIDEERRQRMRALGLTENVP